MVSPRLSLEDLLGSEYIGGVINAAAAIGLYSKEEGMAIAREKIDFYPAEKQKKNDKWLKKVGTLVIEPFNSTIKGAGTDAFTKSLDAKAAPLTGFCNFRVGESGRLYLLGKSEHYHVPLGHRFDGYRLIDLARRLGILNPTHNNTRGYITRLTETRLVQAVNSLSITQTAETEAVLSSRERKILNRVINLETGSLAVEAGVKMMLSRFYPIDFTFEKPKYYGKTPVFFVMADQNGGSEANYHGTTVLTQTFRGLWQGFYEAAEKAGLYKVVPLKINDINDFQKKIKIYNQKEYKTAGFLHEIILMNYGAIKLEREYLQNAYELCAETDTPALVDEIQSCMWYSGMFLFRLYGLKPDFVVLGKGFPGGEYPASKIITTGEMDSLNLFGALVTNGQEELASLSYLITMAFAEANGNVIETLGNRFFGNLQDIQKRHSDVICKICGQGHLAAIHFNSVQQAVDFAKRLNAACIDSSAQIYKPNCPPAVLLKPPVIASEATLDFIAEQIEKAIILE